MAKITIREVTDKLQWETFLKGHPEANFLQSWYWGEFHEKLNQNIQRIGFYSGDDLIGVMLSVVENARRGRYLTVAGGPIIPWEKKDAVLAFIVGVKKIATEQRCVFIRVRPQLVSNEFSKKIFRQYGFINAPMHLHAELTLQLDITKTEEEILSNMRKTTRYEIKKAGKEGILISTTTDPGSLKAFYDLQIETAARQGFIPFSYSFLYEQFVSFATSSHALLYSAHLDNVLLAQAFIIFYGSEAVYHYGASTEEGRRHPGAYLLQWEAIKQAKQRKMQRYNFWGVAPVDQSHHRFFGVSVFKRGFGGEEVAYLHAQDLVIKKIPYYFASGIEHVRKTVRRV